MSLLFQDFKLLEEIVKERWDGLGYRSGQTDIRIAQEASGMLSKLVSTGDVASVRKALGYEIRVGADEPPAETGFACACDHCLNTLRRVIRIEAKLHALANALGVSLERKPVGS